VRSAADRERGRSRRGRCVGAPRPRLRGGRDGQGAVREDAQARAGHAGLTVLAKRVIPCLDVDAGRVVKGTRFVDLVDAGDPVELAARYDREGADELVFLDITATVDGRASTHGVISRTAEQVFIPLTVGG